MDSMKNEKRLCDLSLGEVGCVKCLLSSGSMRRRLLDIGLCCGTEVRCVGESPLGDLRAFLIRGSEVAIRRHDAEGIIID